MHVIPSSVLLTSAVVVANTGKKDVSSLNAVDIQKRTRLSLALGMCYAWLGGGNQGKMWFCPVLHSFYKFLN